MASHDIIRNRKLEEDKMIAIKYDEKLEEIYAYTEKEGNYIHLSARDTGDNNKIIAVAACSENGEIVYIKVDDMFLYDGMIKSVINYMDVHSVFEVFSFNKDLFPYMRKIGFSEDGERMFIDTNVFFGKKCKEKN